MKTVHDKLVIKVDVIDTKILSTKGLFSKAKYDSDREGLKGELNTYFFILKNSLNTLSIT